MAADNVGTARPLDEYVEAEIQRLLAEDGHVAEQGIRVLRREHALILCGEVESAQRRDEICRQIADHFPDVELSCDIGVVRAQAPSEAEELW
jgi:hypothetical protein